MCMLWGPAGYKTHLYPSLPTLLICPEDGPPSQNYIRFAENVDRFGNDSQYRLLQ